MADASTVTVLWGVTAGVSAYYQIHTSRDPYPVLMASALGYGATAIVGQFFDWRVAAALAVLVCLGVVVYRSGPIIAGLTALISSPKGS